MAKQLQNFATVQNAMNSDSYDPGQCMRIARSWKLRARAHKRYANQLKSPLTMTLVITNNLPYTIDNGERCGDVGPQEGTHTRGPNAPL